ncbi:MAG TPA: ATP-binding protein [bacterium]|nr:ATP-binding protein [bacterium]
MKIKKIVIENIGPFTEKREFDFTDSFSGKAEPFLMFSGVNGSGKSTLLNAISYLWEATGLWHYSKKSIEGKKANEKRVKDFFGTNGCFSMLIEDFPDFLKGNGAKCSVIIHYGDNKIKEKADFKIGEKRSQDKPSVFVLAGEDSDNDNSKVEFFGLWAQEYKKLIQAVASKTPNIIYLDAEARRWIKAEKGIGEPIQEDNRKRWIFRYEANSKWDSQLEASLITLKTTKPQKFHDIVKTLNRFLKGKVIETDISEHDNRLRVYILKNGRKNGFHYFDELSAGERDILTMTYSVARWMEKGAVVLLDEPDIFLHPSIIADFFSLIEQLVKENEGQLIVTSHQPQLWDRYDLRSRRIDLSEVVK